MHALATTAAAVGVNKSTILRVDQYASPNAPAPNAKLRLRAELAEQQVADLKLALENMKGERDMWRTIAECSSLPNQRAEGNLARRELREWWWRLTE